jgi:hypothetical protein
MFDLPQPHNRIPDIQYLDHCPGPYSSDAFHSDTATIPPCHPPGHWHLDSCLWYYRTVLYPYVANFENVPLLLRFRNDISYPLRQPPFFDISRRLYDTCTDTCVRTKHRMLSRQRQSAAITMAKK